MTRYLDVFRRALDILGRAVKITQILILYKFKVGASLLQKISFQLTGATSILR